MTHRQATLPDMLRPIESRDFLPRADVLGPFSLFPFPISSRLERVLLVVVVR